MKYSRRKIKVKKNYCIFDKELGRYICSFINTPVIDRHYSECRFHTGPLDVLCTSKEMKFCTNTTAIKRMDGSRFRPLKNQSIDYPCSVCVNQVSKPCKCIHELVLKET